MKTLGIILVIVIIALAFYFGNKGNGNGGNDGPSWYPIGEDDGQPII